MLAARARLQAAGLSVADAAFDARLLAQHVLGWDAARFLSSDTEAPPERFATVYEPLIARRAQREPLAYLTGRREFWGLAFEVSPAVLIPRPETELLVETALHCWPRAFAGETQVRVADVCTGSGCIAVAVAVERPAAAITATDISAAALEVAERNIVRHQVADQVRCHCTSLLEGLPGPFDLILSNPPYVPEGQRSLLQPEVGRWEPPVALFGGAEGTDVIARLIAQAADRLRPAGLLLFEFGAGQAEAVAILVGANANLQLLELKHDLQGIARVAMARRT